MRGGCRRTGLLSIFFASVLLACGENRGADTPAAGGPAVGVAPDTAAVAEMDTAAAPAEDSTPAREKPAPEVARATPPAAKPAAPAPRPAAPAPTPAAPEPEATSPEPAAAAPEPATPAAEPAPPTPAVTDTPPATAPVAATDTAPAQQQASAPLRDEYHRAPLDTVSQEVYDGWKQYNLNCARCHGEDVLGTTIAPHLLASVKPDGPIDTKELFIQTVCAGRPEKGMPAWCPLGMEMDKIQAIFAYVKGRSDGKIRPGRPALKEG